VVVVEQEIISADRLLGIQAAQAVVAVLGYLLQELEVLVHPVKVLRVVTADLMV
jgi:hypothetical protein